MRRGLGRLISHALTCGPRSPQVTLDCIGVGNAFRDRILADPVVLSAHARRHLPVACLIVANQFIPLPGARGLQPVRLFVRHVPFRRAPSLFYTNCSDQFITATIWCGVALSIFTISGFSESFGLGVSMLTWALLWMIYLSLVNVGQTFYGFGWETMLAAEFIRTHGTRKIFPVYGSLTADPGANPLTSI